MMIFSLYISTSAAEADGRFSEDLSHNYHVSPINPLEQITTFGTDYPRVAWNVVTEGPYYFSGQAAFSRLYLSYLLYGTMYFEASVTNRSSNNELTVNPHDSTILRLFTVAPNSTTDPLGRLRFTVR